MKNMLSLCLLILAFVPFSSTAQLDSASVNTYFETVTVQLEGLDSTATVKAIKTETWVNDFDFFGEIIVTAYDQETDYPVHKIKHTAQSILDNNLYNSGIITINIQHGVEEEREYRVEVIVRDYQGMNYPIISKTVH
ncbi:hypothetical protein H9Y05_08835 [Crocinitomicaceae bacterium CZZ-1]|uniref:Uncharacterized protein n=1 Tax=Taishania pollutisoli TaxID=2766479 RepID=A0A8J6PPS2_9FLAO|nr:hypothetical protein [Taishania pollutisoli]MBC9812573.1 hypothetical protein [Taishania pollutisoli]MBX2949269.1 hypothetical protein [Crocinitomicaceae bacterium]NGF77141.1 hypothetical protein [Fluviicola sp. SGL-29]